MANRAAIIGVLLLAAFGLTVREPVSARQDARGDGAVLPAIFGEGVLSAGEIYRGSFTADGRTFYFFRSTGGNGAYRIVVSRRDGGTWTAPRPVDLGGEFSDLYPSLTRDDARLIFSSYRPIPGGGEPRNAHLWYADRRGDGWGPPVFMGRASAPGHYHSWVHVGFDDRVYFRRTSPDWKATQTLVTRWNGREYEAPVPFDEAERWKGWRPDVTVVGGLPGPDGRTVFLDVATRNPATGRPASDIWVSTRRGDQWTDPRPLGAGINADGYDVFPFFSPDGQDLYFVRDFKTFHRIPLRDALAETSPALALRYVANAGVVVAIGGAQVLVDAPIRDGIAPYATSTAAERDRLEHARPPYDRIDAILVTHWHEDHFSADAVAAHLSRNTRAVLVSSPEVVARVRAVDPSLGERLRPVLPPPGASELVRVGSLPVRVLRIRHNPTRRLPEQHVGFLIGEPAAVLHTGDADPDADNFALLRGLPAVDLALLPFWFLQTDANRQFVQETIRPRRVAALHLPPADAVAVERAFADARVRAVLLTHPGTDVPLP